MKSLTALTLAAAMAVAPVTAAFAQEITPVEVNKPVVSSAGMASTAILIPLVLLVLVAAAVASSDDDSSSGTTTTTNS
jgi:hypothetical protein